MFLRCMGNVLDDEKQQQICALGRLGWTLSRIQATTGIRRETVSGYLRAAGIPVRGRGRPSEAAAKAAISPGVSTDLSAKPAITAGAVSTDPARAPSASACEPYRELIVEALGRSRNAVAIWQDLVDDHGFTARYASIRRFVLHLRGTTPAEARVVITTAPGEDYGKSRVMLRPMTIRCSGMRSFRSSGIELRIIPYSASSQASRSFGGRPRLGLAQVGVPARVSASRFMSRSIWM